MLIYLLKHYSIVDWDSAHLKQILLMQFHTFISTEFLKKVVKTTKHKGLPNKTVLVFIIVQLVPEQLSVQTVQK